MDHPEARIVEAARLAGFDGLDGAALARLQRYLDLLQVWNARFHLTGDRDLETLIDRHVADSLAVAAEVPDAGHLVDIGTGAGFPGVVVACARPDARVTLIESRRRPVSFLAEAGRHVPLPSLRTILARAEDAASHGLLGTADVVVSRAVRADAFLPLAVTLLAAGGFVLLMTTAREGLGPVEEQARAVGLEVVASREYVLARGEPRRLVRLARADTPF
jgi:16S rRNA (guanine527-N7)-methyltransferase